MCAIAGVIDFASARALPPETVERMLATMRRRGPDQEGTAADGPATLLHRRLSVMDLQGGRQPMTCTAGTHAWTLVYNGELYNTPELRTELEGLGHEFHESSDTEVLLHSYIQWGADCVERLNGIFAFAVWEHHDQRLFLARDRIGVKPLFYAVQNGALIFASELKTLLAHGAVEAALDREGLAEILLLGPGRTPGCGVFHNVFELEPGCRAWFDADGLRTERYWRLTPHTHRDSFDDTAAHVRALVLEAIERQLVSDVPVCTFLSGGLDSSVISAVADRYMTQRGRTLHTFSVDYAENDRYFQASHFQPNSDNRYIEVMNGALHAVNHRVVLDSVDVANALLPATEARDLPGMADVDSSLLLFCGKIREQATVALSGECADEIFGGYPWYRDKDIRARAGFPWAQSTAYRTEFLTPELREKLDAFDYIDARYRQTIAESLVDRSLSPIDQRTQEMVNLNFRWFMQTLLDRKDRMSMYHGLEVRVPFCDWRIADYLYSVPWELKDWHGYEKGLLRHAMTGILLDEVLWRKKSPYPKTHHPAYLTAVSTMLRKILADPAAPLLQIADRHALERLLTDDRATPWYGQLMTTPQTIAYFVQIDHWLRAYHVRLL
ncbi:MAG: asparagine synthase (glutamine-hydrolyzing) [Oscillospiraceae bacterium]|nr:asparagine synthase (glutamine-hydrolyzing) [Oscillospiraceae bacterium]